MTFQLPENAVPCKDVYLVDITPELAEKWLNANPTDRPLLGNLVQRYADSMKNDYWHETHQGIVFNRNGELIDGRLRLHAVIQSGKTVTMRVILHESQTEPAA